LIETIAGDNGTAIPQEVDAATVQLFSIFGEAAATPANPADPAALVASTTPAGNPYVDNCNLGCHKNCLGIKKRVSFPVLEMCVKDKCHCDHSLALT
jgi:hypothetical protein